MNAISQKYVSVRYVGLQPKKRASSVVQDCPIVWAGQGDVQPVPEHIATILLQPQYDKIWRHADDVHPIAGTHLAGLTSAENMPKAAEIGAPSVPVTLETTERSAERLAAEVGTEQAVDEVVRERIREVILRGIPKLIKREDYDANGKPKCQALERVLKRPVPAAERDSAWSAVQDALKRRQHQISPGGVQEEASEPAVAEAIPE